MQRVWQQAWQREGQQRGLPGKKILKVQRWWQLRWQHANRILPPCCTE